MHDARHFDAAVLTGGRSSRMGGDKALMTLRDKRLVDHAVDAARVAGARQIVTVGGDGQALVRLGYRWVPDRWPGQGPLGGIITALQTTASERVMVLACDHVAPTAAAIVAVVAALDEDDDVAIPVVDGSEQTLHGAWHRRCLPHLEQRFAHGARSVRAGLDGLTVRLIERTDRTAFVDADTPAELLAAGATRYHRPPAEEGPVTVTEIDVDQLDALDPTTVQLIDVREVAEYEEARVRGAVLVPLASVPDAIDRLDGSRTVYVICAAGGRSLRAAEFLADAGFDAVNIAGGTNGWISSGRPVDRGPATA